MSISINLKKQVITCQRTIHRGAAARSESTLYTLTCLGWKPTRKPKSHFGDDIIIIICVYYTNRWRWSSRTRPIPRRANNIVWVSTFFAVPSRAEVRLWRAGFFILFFGFFFESKNRTPAPHTLVHRRQPVINSYTRRVDHPTHAPTRTHARTWVHRVHITYIILRVCGIRRPSTRSPSDSPGGLRPCNPPGGCPLRTVRRPWAYFFHTIYSRLPVQPHTGRFAASTPVVQSSADCGRDFRPDDRNGTLHLGI